MPTTDQQKIIEIKVRYDQAVQGIAKYTQAINQLKEEQKQLKDELKQGTISQQEYNTAMTQNRERVKTYQADIRALSKEFQNNVKEQRENEGSLVQLRAQLSRLTATYDQLSRDMRKGEFGESMRKQIMEVSQELKEAEEETNRFYRNVGNYASGWNGLNVSVQQILRELPNAAMSMNTFFLAISNNIPMLVDEINRLRAANKQAAAEGQAGVSVWKALGSAFFSWNTLISVGVTLLTVYGGELVKWIANLFKAKEEVNALKEEQAALNTEMASARADGAKEIANLRTLYAMTQNTNASMQDRIAAVKQLQSQYPAYFGNLSKEAILAGQASAAYKQLAQDIISASYARAYQNRIDKLTAQNASTWQKSLGEYNWLLTNKKAYNEAMAREKRRLELIKIITKYQYDRSSKERRAAEEEIKSMKNLERKDRNIIDMYNQHKQSHDELNKSYQDTSKIIEGYANNITKNQSALMKTTQGSSYVVDTKKQETEAQKAARLRAEANKKALEEQQKAEELLNKLIENNLKRRRAEITTQYDNEIATLKNRLKTEKNLNADARKAMNSQITSLEKIKNQELAKLDEEAIRAEVERETQRLSWLLEAAGEDYRKRRDIKLRELEDEEKLEEARIKVEVTDEKERQAQLEALHQAFNARRKAVTDEYVKNTTDAQVKAITEEFTRQINATDDKLEQARLEMEQWQKIRDEARQLDGESAEDYAKRIDEINRNVTQSTKKYNQAQLESEQAKWSNMAQLTNAASQLLRNFGEDNKAMTALAKTLALATVAINTGKAISEAIAANAITPWAIAGIIAQVLAAMATATSIINSAKFATGGLVSGPGTGTSDSIPARLSNGESVMTARATGMFAPLLSSLNQLGGGVPITTTAPTQEIGIDYLAAAVAKGMESMPRPVVSVEEINRVGNRVEVIERMGRV